MFGKLTKYFNTDLNTLYMTNSTLMSPVKMEYGWNFSVSGLKMMMKSGLGKICYAQPISTFIWQFKLHFHIPMSGLLSNCETFSIKKVFKSDSIMKSNSMENMQEQIFCSCGRKIAQYVINHPLKNGWDMSQP